MIHLFNRKEVALCLGLKHLEQVRSALDAKGIAHTVKCDNRTSPNVSAGTRGRSGSFGQQPMMEYSYKVYVHKKDAETAKAVIGRR